MPAFRWDDEVRFVQPCELWGPCRWKDIVEYVSSKAEMDFLGVEKAARHGLCQVAAKLPGSSGNAACNYII